MKYYFSLQATRLERWFREVGINPVLGLVLALLGFVLSSVYLFYKTELAPWIYLFFAVYFLLELGDKNRNIRLRNIYNNNLYLGIRFIENGLAVIPFMVFLIFKQEYLLSLGLLPVAIGLSFFNSRQYWSRVIPTPFKRFPFEFIVGFRKTLLFVGLAYFLIFKGIQVANYNLGLAALCLLFMIIISYYLKPEKKYFVWIFTADAKAFLKRKMFEAFICTTILTMPALIILCFVFPDIFMITLVVSLIGNLFVSSIIVAKYSAYPKEMNLPQGILCFLSITFPPMLLIIIPIFYKKAKRNLKLILE